AANPVTSKRRKLSVAGDLSATSVVEDPKFLPAWSDWTRVSATGVKAAVSARAGAGTAARPTDPATRASDRARRARRDVRATTPYSENQGGFVPPVPNSSLCVVKTLRPLSGRGGPAARTGSGGPSR